MQKDNKEEPVSQVNEGVSYTGKMIYMVEIETEDSDGKRQSFLYFDTYSASALMHMASYLYRVLAEIDEMWILHLMSGIDDPDSGHLKVTYEKRERSEEDLRDLLHIHARKGE